MSLIKSVTTVLDGVLIIIICLMMLALVGVNEYSVANKIILSVHRISLPFTYFIIVLLIRMIIISPRGYSPWQLIDYWLNKAEIALERNMLLPGGRVRTSYSRLFRLIGVRVPGSDIPWNGIRATAVIFLLLVTWLIFSPTYRYLHYGPIPDLGIFFESMINAANGGMFENSFHFQMFHSIESFVNSPESRASNFAHHFQPVLFLLLPIFNLLRSPITLFVVQAVIVGAGVFPCFLLARSALKREDQSIVVTICYALYPSVLSTSWSFFPDAFAITFLLWAFWFSLKNRHIWMGCFLILTLSAKETMALPVLSFGAYLFLWDKKRLLGLGVAIFSVLYLLTCLHLIIPYFGDNTDYPYVKGLYGNLGSSLPELLRTLILKPWKVLPYLFSFSALKYLWGLLFPTAFLPLIGWRIWILTLPVLLQNLLVNGPQGDILNRSSTGLWSATLIPFTFLSLTSALLIIRKRFSPNHVRYALAILMITTLLSLAKSSPPYRWSVPAYRQVEEVFRELAPEKATISTNMNPLWSPLVLSYDAYLFPKKFDQADFAFIEINTAYGDKLPATGPKEGEHHDYHYYKKLDSNPRFVKLKEMASPRRGYTIFFYKKIQ